MVRFAGDDDPEALLEQSRSRLRRVPLSNITLELLQRESNGTAKERQELSEPCGLREIDFFISWVPSICLDASSSVVSLLNTVSSFSRLGTFPNSLTFSVT